MSPLVDFQQLKTRVSIEQVLDMLNIRLKHRSGHQWRGSCPICHEGGDRAFAVTPARNVFICFGQCKKRGDIIALVAAVKDVPAREAAQIIDQHFGAGNAPDRSSHRSPQPPQSKNGFDVEKYLAGLDPEHPNLEPLGIATNTLREGRGGYATTGVHRGKLALPVTRDGVVVGYLGRAIKEGDSPTLSFPNGLDPHEYIFGEDRIGEGTVQLVRDVLDVLRAAEMGISAVCFLTETVTPLQLEMLSSLMDKKRCDTLEF